MDTLTGAEAAVRMLDFYGVRHIFGLCGDTSLPFYDALYRMEHGITHVLTRDERSAAYVADGYARVSGTPGVCEGPSGGGATYLLPGLVEANESSSPVLGITSDVPVLSRGRYPLTELDQEALYRPLTKWNTVCDRADQVPQAIRTAFRYMTTGRPGAAHIGLPYDVLKQPVAADAGALERHVRLDQGQPEGELRRSLLLGRLHADRSRANRERVRGNVVARGRSGTARPGAAPGCRARRSGACGHRRPVAGRRGGTGAAVDGMNAWRPCAGTRAP
jgi:thiamine pyrophosphate-dependent acetolactate synthase large subunit-like protein